MHREWSHVITPCDAEDLMAARVSARLAAHCRSVAGYAARLASRWGADPEQATVAGLLHDLWRERPAEDCITAAQGYGVPVSALERRRPVQLLHAPLAAAELASRDVPAECLEAIRCHTVGAAGMSTLARCLFFADGASPERRYEGVEELRALADASLDMAVVAAVRRGLVRLVEKGDVIHPATVDFYNELHA
jgi:predicted HD superfamily hydrolase involved in NAD metabolism